MSLLIVDAVTGVEVTAADVVDDSSFLTTDVLAERSRNVKVKRRFSLGLCSSERLVVVVGAVVDVAELPP